MAHQQDQRIYDYKKIKLLLEQKGWNMSELARRTGIKPSSMSLILRGKTKTLKDSTLYNMANALGVSMKEILVAGAKVRENPQDSERLVLMFDTLSNQQRLMVMASVQALYDQKPPKKAS